MGEICDLLDDVSGEVEVFDGSGLDTRYGADRVVRQVKNRQLVEGFEVYHLANKITGDVDALQLCQFLQCLYFNYIVIT